MAIKRITELHLEDSSVYKQALGCLKELGQAENNVDTRQACHKILLEVIDLGLVLARCDLHRRFPIMRGDLLAPRKVVTKCTS